MANQITVYLDPAQMPSRTVLEQKAFDDLMAAFFANLPTFGAQFNAGIASFNAAAAGSAYAIPYTIDLSSTADADPGSGKLRFDSATQNLATTLRLDVLGAGSPAVDYTAMIDTFDASTSTVKGSIRIVKQGDGTKFLLFDVTARTAPSGYRDISVTPRASTSANPFVNGDAVLLFFQRNGDKGDQGQSGFSNMVVVRSTQTWTPPAGVSKARITVIDGGNSGTTSNNGDATNGTLGGKGGNASISIRAVNSATTYTATVGSGGAAPASGTGSTGNAGGASSFSGTGFTTLTSANGDLIVPGGAPVPVPGSQPGMGGTSLYARTPSAGVTGSAIGQGGGGTIDTQAGKAGAAGAIIIEY